MALRRARGALLRLVRRRPVALLVGTTLMAPAAWLQWSGRADRWWVEGLALVLVATGAAIFWTGLTGLPPDWIDES